jgi:hypothetical protein
MAEAETAFARRYREIIAEITSDQGGADRLSKLRRHLIHRFAACTVIAERNEARLLHGETIDVAKHASLCSVLVRLAHIIGVDRAQRNLAPSLADFLRSNAMEASK